MVPSLLVLGAQRGLKVELESSVDLPGFAYSSSVTYHAASKRVVFEVKEPAEKRGVWVHDLARKAFTRLSSGRLLEQRDNEMGWITVTEWNGDLPKTTTFDIATGRTIHHVDGRYYYRVGAWLVGESTEAISGPKAISRSSRWPSFWPVWITPKKWILTHGGDTKDLVEVRPGTTAILKKAYLSDWAMQVNRVVGNPETGPFAVWEASNRSEMMTGAFNRNFQRVDTGEYHVLDVGPAGFFSCILRPTAIDYHEDGTIAVLSVQSGKPLWKRVIKNSDPEEEHNYGGSVRRAKRFMKSNWLLVGRAILDARSGARLAILPPSCQGIAWVGPDFVYAIPFANKPPSRLLLYRVKPK